MSSPESAKSTSPSGMTPVSQKPSRRPAACKSCHSLKVKCTPSDPKHPSGPCLRCLNSKRVCEIDLNRPRKRRRKAEIEEARAMEAAKSDPQHSKSFNSKNSRQSSESLPPPPSSGAATVAPNSGYLDHTTFSNKEPEVDFNSKYTGFKAEPPKPPNIHQLPPIDISVDGAPPDSSMEHSKQHDPNEVINQLTGQIQNLKAQVAFYRNKAVQNEPPQYISKKDLEHELKILSKNSASEFMGLSSDLKQATSERADFINSRSENVDVLSRKIITNEEAEMRLSLYRDKIYPIFPYIDIDQTLLAKDVAQKEPYLFNAIMSVSNIIIADGNQGVSQVIDIETTKQLMTQVFIAGAKNEELLKSLVIMAFWYNTPELVKQRRFHLLNAVGISMLHDLGIVAKDSNSTGDNKSNKSSSNVEDKNVHEEGDENANNKTSIQQRKLVMLLYISTVSTCMILRRSIYVKWTPYVEECCRFLEESEDLNLLHLSIFSRLNHELEKIHNIIHSSENTIDSSSATKYVVREFQKKLTYIKSKITENQHGLLAFYYSIEAYLHEPMLTEVAGVDEYGEVYFKEEALKSISRCTLCCLQCLEEFSNLGSEKVAISPLVYISRMIYTAGILLRLRYLILSFPLYIEKELVPPAAITVVQNTNLVFIKAAKKHPYNYALKKTSLMLQLFIQTYANQVSNLLTSDDGTPNNLKQYSSNSLDDFKLNLPVSDAIEHLLVRSTPENITTESGIPNKPHVPLQLLSNAASWSKDVGILKDRRINSISGSLSNSPGTTKPYNKLDLTNSEPKTSILANLPNNNTFNINSGSLPLSKNINIASNNSDIRFNNQQYPNSFSSSNNGGGIDSGGTPQIHRVPNINLPVEQNEGTNLPPIMNPNNRTPLSTTSRQDYPSPNLQNILNTPSQANNSAVGLSGNRSFFGVPGFEELDKSFYNIGEEFWSDIVNPDSNNFNLEGKGSFSGDVFSMAS